MKALLSSKHLHYIVLFLLTIITVNSHYHFGDINHIEQLPHIFAHQDETYLNNDFFVTYTREINPRYYYSKVIAYFTNFLQLEHLFYLSTLVLNYFILVITFYSVKEMGSKFQLNEPNQHLNAYLSVAFLSLFTFGQLGGAGSIVENMLVPQLVAMPFILLAYWQSIRGNFTLVLICSLLAVFMQPSLVLLTLVPICANLLLREISWSQLFRTIALALIVILTTYVLFIRFTHSFILSDQDFIHILANFRHPHHYIPSQFPLKDYIITFLMLSSLGIAFVYLIRSEKKDLPIKSFVTTTLISLTLLFAGYLFVEVYPLRIIVSLQTFRIMFLLRWLFVVVTPLAIAKFLTKTLGNKRTGVLIALITCIFATVTVKRGDNSIVSPQISMATSHYSEIFKYISTVTPKEALFLTPHNFGEMRIDPKRAIVVDTKAFPFNDSYMYEWYSRVINSYGEGDLAENYKNITDDKLLWLKDLYNFDFVILFSQTDTNFEVIYEDADYKIIDL